MATKDVSAKKQALHLAKGWIFLLLLIAVTAFSFIGLRYRLHKKYEGKRARLVQAKHHIYVQPSGNQPEIPIVYAQSL